MSRNESDQEFWDAWREAGKPLLLVVGLKYPDDSEVPSVEMWDMDHPDMKVEVGLDELVIEYWKRQSPKNVM